MFLVATRSPPYLRLLSPGGSTVVPGGYGVLLMERENCSLASLSWQRYKIPGRELALQR
jgi:hypothetical protein